MPRASDLFQTSAELAIAAPLVLAGAILAVVALAVYLTRTGEDVEVQSWFIRFRWRRRRKGD